MDKNSRAWPGKEDYSIFFYGSLILGCISLLRLYGDSHGGPLVPLGGIFLFILIGMHSPQYMRSDQFVRLIIPIAILIGIFDLYAIFSDLVI